MNSTALARAVVEALLRAGVRQVVLAPGSRNAPLSFALYDAATAGVLDLHTRIDERTGGFLALGIAKTSRRPVAVVTTSGTAAANLHPALMEAAHSGIALVAVTADRPARLRGTIANQTTDQVAMFGTTVVRATDLTDAGQLAGALAGLASGPVHLNVQLDDPLMPEDRFVAPEVADLPREHTEPADPLALEAGPATVVVAGDDAGPGARTLAESANWPLLAEPSSGARNGANVIRSYRLLLGTPLADDIERVVLIGSPTLSRPVQRLLARDGLEVVARRPRGVWADRPHPVTREHDGRFEAAADDPAWLERWRQVDRELSGRVDALVADQPDLTPYDVAAAVNAAVPAGGLLHVGASNPIRDLDLMARPYPVGERRLVIANRGLAGIDGTLSTAIGAVLGRPHTTRAIAYLGDVTFLHDLTGLVVGPTETRPDLTIVVANDDGGSIFATLEQGAQAHAAGFEKLFGTPHGVDLAGLCGALRIPHWRVHDRAELDLALANPNGGIEVVEARIRRDNRRALDAQIKALATG